MKIWRKDAEWFHPETIITFCRLCRNTIQEGHHPDCEAGRLERQVEAAAEKAFQSEIVSTGMLQHELESLAPEVGLSDFKEDWKESWINSLLDDSGITSQGFENSAHAAAKLYATFTKGGNKGLGKAILVMDDGGMIIITTPEYSKEFRGLFKGMLITR